MGLALVLVSGGALAATAGGKKKAVKAVVFVDYSKAEAKGNVFGDDSKSCGGTFEEKGGAAVFSFRPCADGWGAGVTLMRAAEGPLNAGGTTRIVLKAKVTKGIKIGVQVNENGIGPKDAPSYAGVEGADGEQWASPEQVGTGIVKTYTFTVKEFTVAAGYGNQNGNKTVDLKAVDALQVSVWGGQAGGEIAISSIKFE
jgi:hypothetical protein